MKEKLKVAGDVLFVILAIISIGITFLLLHDLLNMLNIGADNS